MKRMSFATNATKGDVEMLATTTKAEIEKLAITTKGEMKNLELRLTIKLAGIVAIILGLVRSLEYFFGS